MELRDATIEDWEFLLSLRNDEETILELKGIEKVLWRMRAMAKL